MYRTKTDRLVEVLLDLYNDGGFIGVDELMEITELSYNSLKRRLYELRGLGFVVRSVTFYIVEGIPEDKILKRYLDDREGRRVSNKINGENYLRHI